MKTLRTSSKKATKKPARFANGEHTLQRTAFRTSRLMDFCSEKELIAQTGHQRDDWALVAGKEMVDNALDACEDAGIAPKIKIEVNADGIRVTDNGPGIPESTICGTLDFSVRVSNREAYVAPDRGRQGNALKTLVAMPFVLDGSEGQVEIHAHNVAHQIKLRVDRIRQEPVIDHAKGKSAVRIGTSFLIRWPVSSRTILDHAKARFLQIGHDYVTLNPHLSLTIDWNGEQIETKSTAPKWEKWKPSDPTSPHWYEPEHLERLIAAYVAHDADTERTDNRTVREFVSQFRGLSGSAKQKRVLDATRMARASLADLVRDGELDRKSIAKLLSAMQSQSRAVKPAALGIIGESHLRHRLQGMGCAMETFDYRKVAGETDGLPWIIETAFAAFNEALNPDESDGDDAKRRRLITGVNWSPGIINPFRELGRVGESLDSVLSDQEAGADQPVVMVLHLACPRVMFADRGKSSVIIGRAQQ